MCGTKQAYHLRTPRPSLSGILDAQRYKLVFKLHVRPSGLSKLSLMQVQCAVSSYSQACPRIGARTFQYKRRLGCLGCLLNHTAAVVYTGACGRPIVMRQGRLFEQAVSPVSGPPHLMAHDRPHRNSPTRHLNSTYSHKCLDLDCRMHLEAKIRQVRARARLA